MGTRATDEDGADSGAPEQTEWQGQRQHARRRSIAIYLVFRMALFGSDVSVTFILHTLRAF